MNTRRGFFKICVLRMQNSECKLRYFKYNSETRLLCRVHLLCSKRLNNFGKEKDSPRPKNQERSLCARQLGHHCTVESQDARIRALNRHSETGPACFRVVGQRELPLSELITGRGDNQARNPLATRVSRARNFTRPADAICVLRSQAERSRREDVAR